jgi:hypothetical protein
MLIGLGFGNLAHELVFCNPSFGSDDRLSAVIGEAFFFFFCPTLLDLFIRTILMYRHLVRGLGKV